MGINAITCKGLYTETGKTGFGEGGRTSSDFDGSDLLKGATLMAAIAAGAFVAGCVDNNKPPPAKVEYDKNASQITLGRIDNDETEHFSLNAGKGLLEDGQAVGLRRITENVSVSKDSPFDNICRVTEYFEGLDTQHYHLDCFTNPASDNIGIGDYVAVYKVVEVQMYKAVEVQK